MVPRSLTSRKPGRKLNLPPEPLQPLRMQPMLSSFLPGPMDKEQSSNSPTTLDPLPPVPADGFPVHLPISPTSRRTLSKSPESL